MSDSRKNRVFVRNLDPLTSDVDFVSYFRNKYSSAVVGGNIVRDRNGRSKGYGFLFLVDSSSVSRVLSDRNHVINGKKAMCKIASPRKKNHLPKNFQKKEPKYLRELYVGNLNVSTTNHQLKEYFQTFGTVENAYIVFDKKSKRSKGYGFVEFQNSTSVEQVQEKRPHIINNQEAQTVRTYPKNVPLDLKKPITVLYVYNYNDDVDEESIEEYFSIFGDITMVSRKVKRPEDIKFMELQFDDYDAVDNICLADNHTINGCSVTVGKFLGDNLEKLNNTETQNPVRSAATSSQSNNKRNSNSRPIQPSAPSFPTDDYLPRDPPFNPHFTQAQQQQTLYPSLPSVPQTQPIRRSMDSSSVKSSTRLRRSEGNKDCIIL